MTHMRGTPLYRHPDLWYSSDYGFEWDIYALGVIFFQMLTDGNFFFNLKRMTL
jgi:serine/threonine protein kinase